MVVIESAYIPANNKQDFTCALASGIAYCTPEIFCVGMILIGGMPLRVVMLAPISFNGILMRLIGRWRRLRSPSNSLAKFCALNSPVNNRMLVPELPQSIIRDGLFNPC